MSETIKIDGKVIKCPCYIDKPLHRYNKGCLIQSQVFSEQQTQEKPILRCDEIKNCPIKEQYMQLCSKEQECEELKEKLERQKDYIVSYKSYIYEKEKQLKKQLQSKEQECEELKQWEKDAENLFKTQTDNADKIINRYKQALDEIEEMTDGTYYETEQTVKFKMQDIQDIINKAKEQ